MTISHETFQLELDAKKRDTKGGRNKKKKISTQIGENKKEIHIILTNRIFLLIYNVKIFKIKSRGYGKHANYK